MAMGVLLSGCYLAHGTVEASPIEIGSGFGSFEPIPLEGDVLPILPHPRGQHGVVLSIRVVGIDPEGAAVTCSVIDPTTDRVIAEPRLDELHRWTRWTRGLSSVAVKRILVLSCLFLAPATAQAQPELPYPSWLRLDDAAPPQVPADPSVPLSDAAARIANDVPNEGTPDPGEHYPISNEFSHQLWFEHIRDLGGAFVGVGTDQCYTLAAVQNASMLWLVDFDPLVPVVHRIYAALVPASETPAGLVARFDPANRDSTLALLAEHFAGEPDRPTIERAFRRNHERMHDYLRRVLRNHRDGVAASWLSDPTLYARVRALISSGRVISRNGDVTADGAMRAAGRAAHQLGVTVRVVYFSNAEQFFPFTRGYRENMDALPTDERTIVLRTFREAGVPYPPGERWHYMVHPLADMQARLRENGYRHSRQLVRDLMQRRGRYLGANGVSVLNGDVPRRFDLSE